MKVFLRSVLFNIAFYGWTLICSILFLPSLVLPRICLLKIAKVWTQGVIFICKFAMGLRFKIIGKDNLSTTPSLFAVKHQSAWETIIFYDLLSDPSVVLKHDLLWIPLFGWYLKKLGMVPLLRTKNKGTKDLKRLLKSAEQAISRGQSIVIFPEGTRSLPSQKGIYQSGVASLYLHLNIPVIPVAHNAGLFWPRRGFFKRSGQITLEILDPIKPGLSRKEFMSILESRIESKTQELVREGISYVCKS